MSLSDLSSVASVIIGVAVLASLVYLSLQIRQNAEHARALIQQGRIDRIASQQLRLADADLSSAWLVANGVAATPQAVQQRQFQQQCIAYYIGWDDTLSQYDEGLVSEEQFVRFRQQMVGMFRASPAIRTFFDGSPLMDGSDRLQTFVRELLAKADPMTAG